MSNRDIRKYMTIIEALNPGPTSPGPSGALAIANEWLKTNGKDNEYTTSGTGQIPGGGGWRVGLMSKSNPTSSGGQPKASMALDIPDNGKPKLVKLKL